MSNTSVESQVPAGSNQRNDFNKNVNENGIE